MQITYPVAILVLDDYNKNTNKKTVYFDKQINYKGMSILKANIVSV